MTNDEMESIPSIRPGRTNERREPESARQPRAAEPAALWFELPLERFGLVLAVPCPLMPPRAPASCLENTTTHDERQGEAERQTDRPEDNMAKTSKDKKGASANKNKFKAEDKVFAMDGGDLYEAKVSCFFERKTFLKKSSLLLYCCCIRAPAADGSTLPQFKVQA